jgi:hypothetical protein
VSEVEYQPLAEFLLEHVDSSDYEEDPEGVIKRSNLSPKDKGVLLSRDYLVIRYTLECELKLDISSARITIILGIPTIMLWADDDSGDAA